MLSKMLFEHFCFGLFFFFFHFLCGFLRVEMKVVIKLKWKQSKNDQNIIDRIEEEGEE